MSEQFCCGDDVELCYETFGSPDDPTVLLIMGLGMQMIAWDERFCDALVERGFHVVRFDNRDSGRSTHFGSVDPPGVLELARGRPRRPAYDLADMARDATCVLDALCVDAAHVVGVSMGGMIGQVLAARHPDRVLSLTSIMSTTGRRRVGRTALRVYPHLLRRPPADPAAYVERLVRTFRVIGSRGYARDEAWPRAVATRSLDRGVDAAGTARQLGAIFASGDRTAELGRVTAPTTVIHGTADRVIALSGGRATAAVIAGARLIAIDGMGHDLPPAVWPRIVDAIAAHADHAGPRALRVE